MELQATTNFQLPGRLELELPQVLMLAIFTAPALDLDCSASVIQEIVMSTSPFTEHDVGVLGGSRISVHMMEHLLI